MHIVLRDALALRQDIVRVQEHVCHWCTKCRRIAIRLEPVTIRYRDRQNPGINSTTIT